MLLTRRWVRECDFAWVTRFGRLVKDQERLPATVVGLHFVAFARLMLHLPVANPDAGPEDAVGTEQDRSSLDVPKRCGKEGRREQSSIAGRE